MQEGVLGKNRQQKLTLKKNLFSKVYWPETVLRLGWVMEKQNSFFLRIESVERVDMVCTRYRKVN